MTNGDETGGVAPDEVRAQLERVLSSTAFAGSNRLQLFLRHVTEQTLAGQADRLKGYSIGLEVFGKDPSFDAQADSLVRVEAGRLRKKLEQYYQGEGANDPIEIRLPKGGYAPSFHPTQRHAGRETVGRLGSSGRRIAIMAVALAAGLAVGLAVVWREWGAEMVAVKEAPPPEASEPAAMRGRAVAVLPFENLSDDPAQEYFADGMTQEVIAALSRFEDLLVIASDSSFAYKGRDIELPALGEALRVRYVLLGTVRHAADTVRVTAQLIDVTDGTVVWAENYDRHLTVNHLLDIQSDIAADIVATIAPPFGVIPRERLERAAMERPADLAAYDCVLRTYAYWRVLSLREHAVVRDCLERTTEADPGYGKAWALLSMVYLDRKQLGFDPRRGPRQAIGLGMAAARRAVELNPESGVAFQALATVQFVRFEMAEFATSAERALKLNPHDPTILADLGTKLALIGQWGRGLGLLRTAIERNPVHPGWYHLAFALNAYRDRDYETALARALKVDMPEFYINHFVLAIVYGQLERGDEARSAAARLLELYPEFPDRAMEDLLGPLEPKLVEMIVEGLVKAGIPLRSAALRPAFEHSKG